MPGRPGAGAVTHPVTPPVTHPAPVGTSPGDLPGGCLPVLAGHEHGNGVLTYQFPGDVAEQPA